MNRDRLKELAGDERFISGIYNYCDRWCERCPQTARCMNFAMSEEESSEPETRDMKNEAFWRKISDIFTETLGLLEEMAKERGIDLKAVDAAQEMQALRAKKEAAENHVICRAARSYSKAAGDWLTKNPGIVSFNLPAADQDVNVGEAVAVIRWYQYFITAKLIRAVRGITGEDGDGSDEPTRDSDGSAKVALIAIDRSIGAWGVIPRLNRFYTESVLEIVSLLKLLRQAVEETFPGARSFLRPGLD